MFGVKKAGSWIWTPEAGLSGIVVTIWEDDTRKWTPSKSKDGAALGDMLARFAPTVNRGIFGAALANDKHFCSGRITLLYRISLTSFLDHHAISSPYSPLRYNGIFISHGIAQIGLFYKAFVMSILKSVMTSKQMNAGF